MKITSVILTLFTCLSYISNCKASCFKDAKVLTEDSPKLTMGHLPWTESRLVAKAM
eukprot:Pgem_evm1s15113